MEHKEAKKMLKDAALTVTAFAQAVGVTDVWVREQAKRNGGHYTEIYRLALLGFIQESKIKA